MLRRTRPDAVIFRDKTSRRFDALASTFVRLSRRFGIREIFINGDIKAARKYRTGIHLTATQQRRIKAMKHAGKKVIVSTHTQSELARCRRCGADYLLYSPVFSSPGKGTPKGLEELNQITAKISGKIIALGGITSSDETDQLNSINTYGFASIRYFVKGI